jgi:hypothetical protein
MTMVAYNIGMVGPKQSFDYHGGFGSLGPQGAQYYYQTTPLIPDAASALGLKMWQFYR